MEVTPAQLLSLCFQSVLSGVDARTQDGLGHGWVLPVALTHFLLL